MDVRSGVLGLLGILMVSHLIFLGFVHGSTEKGPEQFQRASETYVSILLALMAPLGGTRGE